MWTTLPSVLSALLDLVLPRSCAGCDAPGQALCPMCRGVLLAPPVGPVRPDPCPAGMPAVYALAPYDGVLRGLLLAHKERGRLGLSRPLGQALASVASGLGPGPLVVCAVPSSRAAVRARGYDHAQRLARAAAGALRDRGVAATASRLLVPARAVADQSGLNTAQRARNLRGAMRARPAPPSRVVLLDDVVTTGATFVEAARALEQAGHVVLGGAVLGATVRRISPGSGSPLHPARDEG